MWKYFEISNISNNISPDILFQRVLSNVLFNTCVYFYSLCGWEKVHVEKHVLPSSVSLFFSLFSFSSFFFSFFVFSTGTKLRKKRAAALHRLPLPRGVFYSTKNHFQRKRKNTRKREERKEKREREAATVDRQRDGRRARAQERETRETRETRENDGDAHGGG